MVALPLTKRIHDLLRWGDHQHQYRSRSELFMAVVTAMVNAGWSAEKAWDVLSDPHNAGGDCLRVRSDGRPRRHARGDFQATWRKAEKFTRERPAFRDRPTVMEAIVRLQEEAQTSLWSGRAGGTDRAVLEAMLQIAQRCGKVRFGAAVRDVAVLAGVSLSTASVSLRRLQSAGWIRRVAKADVRNASTWRLRKAAEHSFSDLALPGALLLAPDTFCWAALGWTKARVYEALDSEPRPTRDLAAAFAICSRAMRGHLSRLAEFNLATRTLDGWIKGPASASAVALELGTAGRQARQRDRLETERILRRQHLAARKSPEHSLTRPEGRTECSGRLLKVVAS